MIRLDKVFVNLSHRGFGHFLIAETCLHYARIHSTNGRHGLLLQRQRINFFDGIFEDCKYQLRIGNKDTFRPTDIGRKDWSL